MKIALVLIAPDHISPIFSEIIDLFAAQLSSLNHEVMVSKNRLKKDHLNLIVAYQYLPPQSFPGIIGSYDYILIQLEQLSTMGGWFNHSGRTFENMRPLFDHALQVWDYAPENIDYLNQRGLCALLTVPGYHASLERCLPDREQDIDVLFYGSPGVRRFELLEQLEQHCKLVKLYNVYGAERDQYISRSKIVLNIHGSEELTHTEQVRLSYLFNNQAFVISEYCMWQPYGNGLLNYDFQDIIPAVLNWLNKPALDREKQRQTSLASLKKIPMQTNLKNALTALNPDKNK